MDFRGFVRLCDTVQRSHVSSTSGDAQSDQIDGGSSGDSFLNLRITAADGHADDPRHLFEC